LYETPSFRVFVIARLSGSPSQFLDCTWQLLQQYPSAFEFNEHFLLAVVSTSMGRGRGGSALTCTPPMTSTTLQHTEVYTARFADFVGNCERER
jgi:hypothetical protein